MIRILFVPGDNKQKDVYNAEKKWGGGGIHVFDVFK